MNERVTDAAVLDWIRLFHSRNGYMPTIREIARGVGLTSTSGVTNHLKRLERDGRIQRRTNSARTIRIVEAA